ncbi:hypothetical protein ACHAW6_000705 [Cyclotella cf. meneghiniana]
MEEESSAAATSSSTPKTSNAAPLPSQQHQESSHNDHDATQITEEDDDMLLVTEFPPPPHYYALASRNTPAHLRLAPPEIPLRAFRVVAKKVRVERKRAKEESERIRLLACAGNGASTAVSKDAAACNDGTKLANQDIDDDNSIDPNDSNEPVVATFGEIVEDPTLTVEEECDDPTVIRENVKRLNQEVLRGFLKLVRVLVNDPNNNKLSGYDTFSFWPAVAIVLTIIIEMFLVVWNESLPHNILCLHQPRKLRDELSHNLFLMLQECNKFREHQARETLITTLEQQLEQREQGLALMKRQINEAEDALVALSKFCGR